jgi:glycosyltransferase involved in cell wall biosynthesis
LFYRSDGDIVHATTPILSIYSYPKPRKFIVTSHGLYTLQTSLKTRAKRFLSIKAIKRADKIIAVSEFAKREVIEKTGIDSEKVLTIYLGVDHSLFKPMNKEDCKTYLGLRLDEKYILVVASDLRLKRMDITKAVFDRIRKLRENIKLLKCGYTYGNLRGEGIINLGFVPHEKMPILYNASDVLLHTSEYESFGMPLLEAMACGTPIVASNKAAIPEVVGDCGELVNLDADNCIEQFAEKVLKCIDKGRNERGVEKARRFSWEIVARKTFKVYEELL